MLDIEKYNQIPEKCKLAFWLLVKLINNINKYELVEKHREQRLKCYETNGNCGFSECIYEMTKKDFREIRCPRCGNELIISENIISCNACGFAFRIIKFGEEMK